MKLSAKSRYALHLMLELAMQEEGVNLSVKTVAESRGSARSIWSRLSPCWCAPAWCAASVEQREATGW